MDRRLGRSLSVVASIAALAHGGCGGGDDGGRTPVDEVRDATSAYLRALGGARWTRACGLMTVEARRELRAVRGSCVEALASGAAPPVDELAAAGREVAGARVRGEGGEAAIGPLGSFPRPLRLERVAGRWLISG